jgi:glutaredoxin
MSSIKFFALSTCIWCRKTRQHLDEMGVKYEYVVVDQMSQRDKDAAMKELEQYNSKRSFPTLVFEGGRVVIGFKPEEIRAALNR